MELNSNKYILFLLFYYFNFMLLNFKMDASAADKWIYEQDPIENVFFVIGSKPKKCVND